MGTPNTPIFFLKLAHAIFYCPRFNDIRLLDCYSDEKWRLLCTLQSLDPDLYRSFLPKLLYHYHIKSLKRPCWTRVNQFFTILVLGPSLVSLVLPRRGKDGTEQRDKVGLSTFVIKIQTVAGNDFLRFCLCQAASNYSTFCAN